jgi:Concanavalin A-like lectin/glucanases superfamily
VKRTLVGALLALLIIPSASASGPISTAVFTPSPDALMFERIHDAGASFTRINVSWAEIAPRTPTAGFAASDPADPRYDWSSLDGQVKGAVDHQLTPYLMVFDAPLWAQKDEPHPTHIGQFQIGSWKPDPAALEAFAHALAVRYGGVFQGLPRVRYFEVWDEPNLSPYLSPQLVNGKVTSSDIYRGLLNAFGKAVHGVHGDNVVIAGSLSGFSFLTSYGRLGISPMLFMRKLLCMSDAKTPLPTCNTVVDLDAVSIHPWTSGSPAHHATENGDISLGDLDKLRRLLVAAARAGHIRPDRVPPLWITEFGWDTKPPDNHPDTAPIALQSRWVSEAIHQAWKYDVRVFTWLLLWDQPFPFESLQSGLFFRNGESFADARPKPTYYAFRFPFVAYHEGPRITLWGRTPYGQPGQVAVQQRTASRWRWIGSFKADGNGIFQGSVRYRKVAKFTPARQPPPRPSTYRDLVVSGQPMSYWPLGEQAGLTASDVTKANQGTYVGGVRLGVPGPFPGTTAADFNGKTARVRLGKITNIHSVELWLKTRTTKDAVAFSNRNDRHLFVAVGTYGGLAHSHDSYPIIAAPVANGRWHHIVYTYDSTTSTGRLYVDGKLSQLAVWTRQEGGADASIGYDADLESFFRGQVADVAVYSYALSPAQVRSHYLAGGRRIVPDVAPGSVRAVELGSNSASLPFSLLRPRDRYVLPFGGGGQR